ncbi:MAG: hypothetical protein ABSG87_00240 [Verrucomicrobiota bacterium]
MLRTILKVTAKQRPAVVLAGASLVLGRAIVNFGTARIDGLDERRKENYEVAYVHEIQKQLGKDK